MVKGKTLGESWDSFPIAPKVPVLLMGSKEEDISRPPPEKIKFMEDMNETELASAVNYLTITLYKKCRIICTIDIDLCLCLFLDGVASWTSKFRKHLLHERDDPVSQNGATIDPVSKKVFWWSWPRRKCSCDHCSTQGPLQRHG